MKECLFNRQVLVGVARLGGCWLRFIKGKGKGTPEPTTCTGVADGGGKAKGLMGSVLLHALLTLQFKDFLSPALLKKTKKDKYYLIGGLTFNSAVTVMPWVSSGGMPGVDPGVGNNKKYDGGSMTVNPVKSAKGHPRRMGKPSREVIVGSYFRIPAIRRRKKLSIGECCGGQNMHLKLQQTSYSRRAKTLTARTMDVCLLHLIWMRQKFFIVE
ncbi:hypothetical protein RHSIM_Rhsim02G0255100 [Rhododendron simsii]|uniref:Uncharacterized protein n=1 Tax=Rhododendron simsii TaxID=118357 RepID=A0A834HCQ0_RHOSS|nr:hypothetical protein RHSIM_Rhsim02G0255100 [Rhododendron simsii]